MIADAVRPDLSIDELRECTQWYWPHGHWDDQFLSGLSIGYRAGVGEVILFYRLDGDASTFQCTGFCDSNEAFTLNFMKSLKGNFSSLWFSRNEKDYVYLHFSKSDEALLKLIFAD